MIELLPETKRCKDCIFGIFVTCCQRDRTYNKFTDEYSNIIDRRTNNGGICKYYRRKKWKFWRPK